MFVEEVLHENISHSTGYLMCHKTDRLRTSSITSQLKKTMLLAKKLCFLEMVSCLGEVAIIIKGVTNIITLLNKLSAL